MLDYMEVDIEDAKKICKIGIENGLNILLMSPSGVGKTSLVFEITKKLKQMCWYLSVPTLDPYIDMIGIPMKDKDGYLTFVRRKMSDEYQVAMLDEFNAPSHYKTMNALKEMLIFKKVNGIAYKKLNSIIGMMNPPDSAHNLYNLDDAIIERFHIRLSIKKEARAFQLMKAGVPKGAAALLVKWNIALEQKYSARTLEYAYRVWRCGINPQAMLGDINDATSMSDTLKKSRLTFYTKDDILNGIISKNLDKDQVKTATGFIDLFSRLSVKDSFWTKDEFLEVYEKLPIDSRSLVFSTLRTKYDVKPEVWNPIRDAYNKIDKVSSGANN